MGETAQWRKDTRAHSGRNGAMTIGILSFVSLFFATKLPKGERPRIGQGATQRFNSPFGEV
jgi:hypothetical protein